MNRYNEQVVLVTGGAQGLGAACSAHRVDVADSGWVGGVAAEHERIDVLVNNAGVIRDNKIDDIDWHTVLDVSLTGSFYCTRAVLPHMRPRQYGRIVSFSSMSWRGNYGHANYVAPKPA